MVRLPRNKKQTYRLSSRAQMWPSGLTLAVTLTFSSRSNMEFLISQPKVVRLPRNEKQTCEFNSRPQIWPIGLTLTITLTFEFWSSKVTFTFYHTRDLDHGFSWSNFEISVSQNGRADWHCTKGVAVGHSWPWPFCDQVRCMDLSDRDRGDFSCRRAVDSSSFFEECIWKCVQHIP